MEVPQHDRKTRNFQVLDLFAEKELVKICAPMVRYSKLQFRNLVKLYDCDLAFTPMIIADAFCKSEKARLNEFTTNQFDMPLITQFAANTVHDFVGAAHLVSPYCNGVDLNCGCPQRWARDMDLGCAMLKNPQVIYDLVRQCRNQINKPFSVSVKMRLTNTVKDTVEICRQLEMCDISFVTVHARTSSQLTGNIDKLVLKTLKDSCNLPVVANGGVTSLEDCLKLQRDTGCDGVMVANGILTNPSLFAGTSVTPMECVQHWLDICFNSTLTSSGYKENCLKSEFVIPEKPHNLTFQCFHHHLVFMLEKILPRKEKQVFNNFRKFSEALEFMKNHFGLTPQLFDPERFIQFLVLTPDYSARKTLYDKLKPTEKDDTPSLNSYNYENDSGNYFKSKISSTDCDWSNIFLEND